MMRGTWQVFTKELRDALRDRRTLLMVLLSSVALGPLLLVALSMLVAEFEARAEARLGPDVPPEEGRVGDCLGLDQQVDLFHVLLIAVEGAGDAYTREGLEKRRAG